MDLKIRIRIDNIFHLGPCPRLEVVVDVDSDRPSIDPIMCQTRWRFDDNDDKADIVQRVKTAKT